MLVLARGDDNACEIARYTWRKVIGKFTTSAQHRVSPDKPAAPTLFPRRRSANRCSFHAAGPQRLTSLPLFCLPNFHSSLNT